MQLGPSFATEIEAAGLLGLPFAWTPDGEITGRSNLSAPQRAALDAVVAAHNPGSRTIDDYRKAIQAHVDATAQSRQYDSGLTCASYVGSTNEAWSEEALAFVAWRDAVWTYAYAELGKVQSGQRPQPSVSDIIGELPAMVWPAADLATRESPR